MRKSEQRFYNNLHFMKSSSFTNGYRTGNPNHFTHNRKMPLPHLLISILDRMELSELNKKFRI